MEEQTPPKSKTTVFVGGISWKVSALSSAFALTLSPVSASLPMADACIRRVPQADEEGLRKYFEEFGTVLECKIIFDRATNKSKGYERSDAGREPKASSRDALFCHPLAFLASLSLHPSLRHVLCLFLAHPPPIGVSRSD